MPWEKRGNGRRYYYKAARIEGRPRRMYLGLGPAGRIHEILDREQNRERDANRQQRRDRVDEVRELNRRWRELMNWLEPLVAAAMALAGWYNHRGQWRQAVQNPRTRQQNAPSAAPRTPEVLRELDSLRARVNAGDSAAKRALHDFLKEHPELYRVLGDLSNAMMITAIQKLSHGDPAQMEIYRQNLEEWRSELLGPDPTAIERGLVDAALSAKLSLCNAEQDALSPSPTHSIAAMKAKTLERAQHRSIMALKKLEEVQRAQGPRSKPAAPQASRPPVASEAG